MQWRADALAEIAWEHTAWICAVIELMHSASRTPKFKPDKWNPLKETPENLSPSQRRKRMREDRAKMPKTFDEFKAQIGQR